MAKRRGHNEGSIFQRKDGRWCAVISLGYENGKLSRKNYYGATRKEVSDKMDDGRANLKRGIAPVIGRQTVAQYLETWLEQCVKPQLRLSTYTSYARQVRLHINASLGHLELTKLTPEHIQRFMNDKRANLGASTVRYQRLILSMALKQAERWGYVPQNVATKVDAPRVEAHEVEPLSQEQAQRLLEALKGERFGALLTVILSLGLRKGEALGLRWGDIDFEAKTITLRYQITSQRVNHELVLTELKTKKSRRVLPLPDALAVVLKERRRQQLEERLQAREWAADNGLVFTNRAGKPVSPNHVNPHLTRVLKAAGLPHKRVHDLRHTAVSILHALGVDMKTISEIAGHANISTTANIYAHVFASVKQDAIEALSRVMQG